MGKIKVIIRTRPTDRFAPELLIDKDLHGITVNQEVPDDRTPFQKRNTCFHFPVHQVLQNVGQETVYSSFCQDVVQGAVKGVNGTVFTYGQTGSGKTFSMVGDTTNYVHRGIAPRAISQIFHEATARTQVTFKITVSYMEIYNERIYDLVDDITSSQKNTDHPPDFKIIEEKGGKGTFARGLTEHEVHTEEDALNLLFSGELRRTTAPHKMNRKSNRSHSIFTVYIQQKSKIDVNGRILTSKLNLVDLAGSERLKKTMDSEDPTRKYDETIKKESMHINQSLSYLEQCVVSLLRKVGAHVPYRQCKLTSLLKDSIGGNSSTAMIACIWGESSQIEETISTLRFASRMTKVQNQVRAVEVLDADQLVRKQEKLIRELKQELLMHDALVGRGDLVNYDPYTPEQQREIKDLCERYLAAPPEEEDNILVFRSLRQMLEMCHQFKLIVKELIMTYTSGVNAAATKAVSGAGGTIGSPTLIPPSIVEKMMGAQASGIDQYVGVEEPGHGFSFGRAPDGARPHSVDRSVRYDTTTNSIAARTVEAPFSPSLSSSVPSTTNMGLTWDPIPQSVSSPMSPSSRESKERAYQMFREGPGKATYYNLCNAKSRLKESKTRGKELAASANGAKREIDQMARLLEHKREERASMPLPYHSNEEIVDEEEFSFIRREKDAKKVYRRDFDQLNSVKDQIMQGEEEVEDLRAELYHDFEIWYSDVRRTATQNGDFGLGDKLDTSEQFEKMEIARVTDKNPDALPYFNANKTMRATKIQCSVSLRQQHKSKRFPNPR